MPSANVNAAGWRRRALWPRYARRVHDGVNFRRCRKARLVSVRVIQAGRDPDRQGVPRAARVHARVAGKALCGDAVGDDPYARAAVRALRHELHVGHDASLQGLTDERLKIVEPRDAQRDAAARHAICGGDGDLARGVSAFPVGAIDGGVQRAVAIMSQLRRQLERRAQHVAARTRLERELARGAVRLPFRGKRTPQGRCERSEI